MSEIKKTISRKKIISITVIAVIFFLILTNTPPKPLYAQVQAAPSGGIDLTPGTFGGVGPNSAAGSGLSSAAGSGPSIIPIFRPFGGRVYAVTWCTCSSGVVIYVGPPKGGPYLYLPGFTRVYEYYQIPRVGPWVLGNYVPGPVCLVVAGKTCAVIPHQGAITIVGTSI